MIFKDEISLNEITMDIESEICRSCGAAGGWSHVCEGIQLGEDGEVDPLLLDLFPALDSVATPLRSQQGKRIDPKSL